MIIDVWESVYRWSPLLSNRSTVSMRYSQCSATFEVNLILSGPRIIDATTEFANLNRAFAYPAIHDMKIMKCEV